MEDTETKTAPPDVVQFPVAADVAEQDIVSREDDPAVLDIMRKLAILKIRLSQQEMRSKEAHCVMMREVMEKDIIRADIALLESLLEPSKQA
jgi:hypothetical protein